MRCERPMDNNEWQGAQSHIYRWKGLHTHGHHMKYWWKGLHTHSATTWSILLRKRWKRQRRHCLSCDTLDVINHCSRLITEQIRSTAWTTNQPPINQRLAISVIDEYYSRRNKRPHIHSTPLYTPLHIICKRRFKGNFYLQFCWLLRWWLVVCMQT